MIKLGIDTTNNNLCLALIDDNQIVHYENLYPCSQSAELLAPKVDDMLKQHKITASDITEVISVTGPGGFSGVRIGTSFVTGFTAGSNIKIIGLSSLEANALSIINPQADSIIIACLDARRDGVYIAIFNQDYQRLTDDNVIAITDLQNFLTSYLDKSYYIAGHGIEIIKPYLNENLLLDSAIYPKAQEFTEKAHLMASNRDNQPIYLRMPDAKLPQKK